MELELVLARLGHSDKNVRCAAALEAGSRADPRALDPLIHALAAEADFFVRETLTWALMRMGEGLLPALLGLLDRPDAAVRHSAAHALSKLGDPRAADRLLGTLDDTEDNVAGKVAWALGRLGERRAIPGLVRLLARESRELQSTVAAVLEGFGDAAAPALAAALTHEAWLVREQASYLLGAIGGDDARAALTSLVDDPVWQVRCAAICALGELGGESAALAVRSRLDDPDGRVRQAAARQVGPERDSRRGPPAVATGTSQ